MIVLELSSIEENFGNDILRRGKDYYDEGRVLSAVEFEGILYAEVAGRADEPYSAEINLHSLESGCTCPYRTACKHAVAALLFYISETGKIINADKKFAEIEKMPKGDIIALLKRLIKANPAILSDFGLERTTSSVKPFVDSFGRAVTGDYNYSAQQVEISKLWGFMEKNVLNQKGKDAVRLCMEFLYEIKKYFNDVDDSDGSLASLVDECIDAVLKNLDEVDEKEKENVLMALKKLKEDDEYGYFCDMGRKLDKIASGKKASKR